MPGNPNLTEEMLDVLEDLTNRVNSLENRMMGSGMGGNRGFNQNRHRIYNSNREEDGWTYDNDYRGNPRNFQGGYRGQSRNYDYEYRGNRMAMTPEDVSDDRIARIRTLSRRQRYTEDLPNLGPTRGEGENEPRAFSATRFGNRDPETGIPVDKSGTIDERTKEGRLATDDVGFSDQELAEMLDTAPRNKDNSIDMRTEQGRALRAAGLIDDAGWPVEELTNDNEDMEEDRGGRTASQGRRGPGRPRMHQGGK